MDAAAVLPPAMQSYLASCSAEHVEEILKVIQSLPQRQSEKSKTNDMKSKARATSARQQKRDRKQSKPAQVNGGPKRPLNSWMAFRKYYSASLSPLTQKAISKILMTFWHEDPFEAKWTMLAKAYSIVRGNREKEEVPLGSFFDLCAPFIAVIPPEQYQAMLGWVISPPDENDETKFPKIARSFTPTLDSLPKKYTSTVLSVDDLVAFCAEMGLVKSEARPSPAPGAENGVLTMAVQPSAKYAEVHNELDDYGIFTSPPLAPGASILSSAMTTIDDVGGLPFSAYFDPSTQFDLSFDPLAKSTDFEAEAMFDAFDMNELANEANRPEGQINVDFAEFVHENIEYEMP